MCSPDDPASNLSILKILLRRVPRGVGFIPPGGGELEAARAKERGQTCYWPWPALGQLEEQSSADGSL